MNQLRTEDKYISKLNVDVFIKESDVLWDFFPSWQEGRRWWNIFWRFVGEKTKTDIIELQYKHKELDLTFLSIPEDYTCHIIWNGSKSQPNGGLVLSITNKDNNNTLEMDFYCGKSYNHIKFEASHKEITTQEDIDVFKSLLIAFLEKTVDVI